MLISDESHQIIWFCTLFLSIIFTVLGFSKLGTRKAIFLENERKERSLNEKPIEELVQELVNSFNSIEEKKLLGETVFAQLNETLTNSINQLNHINVGLLPPTYKFDDSEALKEKVDRIIKQQFSVIKRGDATTAYTNWSWFGSKRKGTQMVDAYRYLLLKAFNAEFDVIRKKMRHSSYDATIKKLYRLEEQLEKLGETANVTISNSYFDLKIAELAIWYAELKHKENLKQEKKEQQALLREQAKKGSGGDVDEIEDDIFYRKSDLAKAQKLAKQLHGASATDIELKIKNMKKDIGRLESKFERAVSQAQLTKAGYIYVISNIGSFGKGVVKIGMTRRLEPMDRVKELGDASVPFKFDVHTLTFVDNAPNIEKKLHHKFNDRRVNIDNHRKEFFKVSPQEVASAMEELDIDSDWYFDIEAKEYRESLLIREARNNVSTQSEVASTQLPTSI
ncbi:DUF4041 domain-containing protein [Candidatus Colwellia aromaticivorans]|uniref:DUF4041 domain-containing protein n=1 Tax=Candidatus Colwellia aromaticivorans TaxID=2267621 RepID=UPI000DF3D678|nr:DUF4041 domain-containing protein [Candidatus Colwellia aromaticivorans]